MAGQPRVKRGKSGLSETTVPGNARLEQSKGQRHRDQTTSHVGDKVKRCGKSAPGFWQQEPHGKPHWEQSQIGVARGASRRDVSSLQFGLTARGRPATGALDEWLPPGNRYRIRLTGHPQFSWVFLVLNGQIALKCSESSEMIGFFDCFLRKFIKTCICIGRGEDTISGHTL